MKTMMTVAAGLALGYLLVQYMNGNMKKTTNGRIHRSTRDRKLAGVCGGIAEWLGIDPTVVRLVWLLMTFGWGMGIMSYIACVIALPEDAPAQPEQLNSTKALVPCPSMDAGSPGEHWGRKEAQKEESASCIS